jgi:hypothetical protein
MLSRIKWSTLWWYAALLALAAPPHLIGIDKFATLDEPWWVISGSNYYYALTHGDFDQTIYDYHPAVTTTWVVTAGMLSYFPEYRGFGQGYYDVRKDNFDEFMREHGKPTLGLLRDSRIIQSLVILVLALLSFFLLQQLIDRALAFLALALAVNAPYFLGHSRLLNHEGLLAIFVLVSLLGMLAHVRQPRRVFLLISGAAFGLAQLTKSSSIVVLGLTGALLLAASLERGDPRPAGAKLRQAAARFGLWLLAAAIVYVALWPGMWAAPGRMLYEVYGNAFSYAFQGARLDITQDLEPARFSLNLDLTGILAFLYQWLARSTPVTWIGILLMIPVLAWRAAPPAARWLAGYLAAAALLFIALFGIAQGRDSGHYILSSYVCLDIVAGLGWGYGLALASKRWKALERGWMLPTVAGALAVLQLAGTLPFYPYYYTYQNPVVTRLAGSAPYGYGEGLELAAAYLAAQPEAAVTRTFVYAGMGPFSYFYPGRTEVLKKAYLLERGLPSIVAEMRRAHYLVVYSAVQDAQPESVSFLRALESVQPEYEVRLGDWVMARIYRISDIPESVYRQMEQ